MLVEPWLTRAARLRPEGVALGCADGDVRYAELQEAAQGAAGRLVTLGVRASDRVAITLPAGRAFAEALHGCLLLGAVAVPVDLRLGAPERARRTTGCAVTVDRPLEHADPVLAPGHDLAAPAVVIHTSGTTADARPVELTYGNWLWSALGSAVALGLDPAERWLCTLPLSHVGGLSILLRSAIYATTAELHDGFDAGCAVAALQDGATLVSVVATTLSRLLDAGLEHPPRLRAALVGGGPIPPALLERARAAGVRTVTTYGLTEACSQVTTGGPALFCTRVRIEAGEILVSGPTVASGAADADGWMRTGDLGALDGHGALTVVGRAADTIVSGGENVAPAAVEAVLSGHPEVVEAGVFGVPDPEWGERVTATIVLVAGSTATSDDLRAYCQARLAGHEVPKMFRYSSSLPKTSSGKLLRRSLEDH